MNENQDSTTYEIMTYEAFWARNPAPDTEYFEITSPLRIIANHINPQEQDPDDITVVTTKVSDETANDVRDRVAVLKWGNWDNYPELLVLHDEAVKATTAGGYDHDCILSIAPPHN